MNIFEVFKNSANKKLKPKLRKNTTQYNKKAIQGKMMKQADSFFTKMMDFRPSTEEDYYKVGWWMVSKKLASFGILLCLLIIIFYFTVISPVSLFGTSEDGIRIYSYDSVPLRLVSGVVKIKDAEENIAFEGRVDAGRANGEGKLFYPGTERKLLYEGNFVDSQYNGTGMLYYENGMICYEGEFRENEYNGIGTLYRQNGSKMYEGEFMDGLADGMLNYYSSSGRLISTGTYSKGMLLYTSLLGNSSMDITESYKGKTNVYYNNEIFLVELEEIGAVYGDDSEQSILQNSAVAANIYVTAEECYMGGFVCHSIEEVKKIAGTPVYEGWVEPEIQELVALSSKQENHNAFNLFNAVSFKEELSGIYELTEYSVDFMLYMYVFQYEGVQYTFYCEAENSNFVMYLLQEL